MRKARGPAETFGAVDVGHTDGRTLDPKSPHNLLPLDYTRGRTLLQLRESGES